MNLTDIYLLQSTKNKTTTFTNYYPDNVVISNIRPYAITQEERLFTRPQQVSTNRLKNGFYAKKFPSIQTKGVKLHPVSFPKFDWPLDHHLCPGRNEFFRAFQI